ncbi:unnamed protein product [Schistosoma mattheei]|uniref:Uncharacterized protein n=1 Tax=Schistosoma mattheei TaxID=31246 RepID=A0A183NNH1_9TREM|nr:unnamed protein product [Schistosoma mattheei]
MLVCHGSFLSLSGLSDTWYSQTAIFCDMDNDSRIVSGGNSSLLYMWDHVGNLLASVDLHDPPNLRLSHILVVDQFNLSESVDSLKLKYHSNCAFFVGGCSPVIRLIANLGYPLGILYLPLTPLFPFYSGFYAILVIFINFHLIMYNKSKDNHNNNKNKEKKNYPFIRKRKFKSKYDSR